jgi:hypothetical protein
MLRHMSQNHRDSDGAPIPDLGWMLSLWNGRDAGISTHLGCYSPHVGNNVVLEFGAGDEAPTLREQEEILTILIRLFEPEHAVATDHKTLDAVDADLPWEAGWLLYERGDRIRRHEEWWPQQEG